MDPHSRPARGRAVNEAVRACVVTNIPAPYRVPVFDLLSRRQGLDLCVLYCARTEPDRHWSLPSPAHPHQFLGGQLLRRGQRFIHVNPSVWSALRRFQPEVVVTTGFNPTHLLAWGFALSHRSSHVVMTDGTDRSESGLGQAHRLVRRMVFATSRSFVVASHGGNRLLDSYGVESSRVHRSPLIANPCVTWRQVEAGERSFDLLWSGRIVPVKNLGFTLEVAAGVAARLGRRVRLAVLGSGPLEQAMREKARSLADRVDVNFAGHVEQAELPSWYARSRLFLFPTMWDPWGVVVNEACEAGVPVLASPHAGAAGELVIDHVNGRVLELNLSTWIDAASTILCDAERWHQMSDASRAMAREFGLQAAVDGLYGAIRQAAGTRNA